MNAPVSKDRLLHELDAIKNYLAAAQDVVKSGHMPTLAGLEDRISRLCESVRDAAPDIQKVCLPELHTLIGQLNACEKAMRESHAGKTSGGGKS